MRQPIILPRRSLLASGLALSMPVRAAESVPIRLGLVQSGTVQWIADTILRHRLDTARGFSLRTTVLANPEAGRISLMGRQTDMVVLDWLFVASQRSLGNRLCFAPLSSATGAIMGRHGTATHGLASLGGKRLGVAGGPLDKSWLVVQAAARKQAGIDLVSAADVVYGAPPLLEAKLIQGELDAVLTYWNFAARLEAQEHPQIVSVAQCAEWLGLSPRLGLVGFVFHQDWAETMPTVINSFLDAARQAGEMLVISDGDWQAVRPLTGVKDDSTLPRLRERFAAGVAALPEAEEQQHDAARLLAVLHDVGGSRATAGLTGIPSGTFWPIQRRAG